MEWISQNWLLIVFGVGMFMLMRRGGMGCGHSGGSHGANAGHGNGHEGHNGGTQAEASGQTSDPVSGKTIDPGDAIATVYQGVPIYFESRENRDSFEAAPEQFPSALAKSSSATPPRRSGCC